MGLEVNIRVTGRSFPNNWSGMRTSISRDEHDKTKMAHAESSLIKHALKSKILSSRQKQGLGDIPVDFTPRPSYPMTQEEKDKDERRRESNRMSAKRSRVKQKTQWGENKKIFCGLESKHKQLLNTISELEATKSAIISDLTNYLPEHRISEILLEKVDYTSCDKNPKTVYEMSGDILEDTDASGDTDQAFDDADEASGVPGDILEDIEASGEISDLINLQLSNDCFVDSAYHTNCVSEENSIDNFDMGVVNALDTILFNSVDNDM